jgi:predicted ATPase/DNA-binding CsgD family transcriptional regulator
VRRERKRHGWYWYAYSRRGGRLRKSYLGKSERLTLERLNAAAQSLAGHDASDSGTTARMNGHAAYLSKNPLRAPAPVPASLTPLIGRERDVQGVVGLLRRSDVRLLTLTGAGGIGKTRLAAQVSAVLSPEYGASACFVSLASVNDPELVLPTIARALGLRESGGGPVQTTLYAHLRKRPLLLVLDNVEQVTAAAPMLVDMAANCPHVKILVTSRTVLHAAGEQEYPVAPLALPDPKGLTDVETLAGYAGVALFLDRAQASKPDFAITPANARAIIDVCNRLDGLPLAIELAARWVKVLAVEQIAARLGDAYTLLIGGGVQAPQRQQTMHSTMDWSYDLLSEQERTLFRRLCVFAGACTLEAAEAICAGGGIEASAVLTLLSRLMDHSLVHTVERDGEVRYQLLEVIKQYGRAKLDATGEAPDLCRRHRDWYLRLAGLAEPELVGREQAAWLNRLEAERDDLRAALKWSLEHNEAQAAAGVAAPLWSFWLLRGYLTEGRRWLDRILAQLAYGSIWRASVLQADGILTGRLGDTARAVSLLEESLSLWRALGDNKRVAFALNSLGVAAQAYGDYVQATRRFEESLALLRESGDAQATALTLTSLALTTFYLGNRERARSLCEECLALFKAVGDVRGVAAALANLGMMSLEQGDYEHATRLCSDSLALRRGVGDKGGIAHTLAILGRAALGRGKLEQAEHHFIESLAIRWELGEKDGVATALEGLAAVRAARGKAHNAARLWGAADALRESSNAPVPPTDQSFRECVIASVRAQLSEKAFAAAQAEGRRFDPEQNQDRSYQGLLNSAEPSALADPTLPLPPAYPDRLTAREVEVLRLVARGLSDNQAAELLVISPRTVQGHLRSVYDKIGINSRSAATRYALERKLV